MAENAPPTPMDQSAFITFRYDLVFQLALSPQQVRLLVLEVEQEPVTKGFAHRTFPVVSLMSINRNAYVKKGDKEHPPKLQATHEGLLRDSWLMEDSGIIIEPLYVDANGKVSRARMGLDGKRYVRCVACDWPPEEDVARLAPIVAECQDRIDPKPIEPELSALEGSMSGLNIPKARFVNPMNKPRPR